MVYSDGLFPGTLVPLGLPQHSFGRRGAGGFGDAPSVLRQSAEYTSLVHGKRETVFGRPAILLGYQDVLGHRWVGG